MTGRNRFTAAELAVMDRLSEKAARLTTDQLCLLLNKYRAQGRLDIVDALLGELGSR